MSRNFSIFGIYFPRGGQWFILRFRRNIRVKNYFFLRITTRKSFSSEIVQKTLSLFNQSVSWMILKTALFISRRTLWMKQFCLENVIFCIFFGLGARKFRQSSQKSGPRWQNSNWGKWFSLQLIWFLKLFSHFDQKFSDFGRNFSKKMSILPSPRQEAKLPESHSFLGTN